MTLLIGSDSGSTEWYGWVAAIVAGFAYGTYGVPIKETKKLPVHPLVFQSYKTSTMFLCCWFVLLMPNVSFSFSPWGLISGLLWVLGGTMGVIAVRYAGMAIAVGTWASVMICVNFVWGILIFEEPVANETATAGAFLLLTIGLVGMSKYSEPTKDSLNKPTSQYVSQSPVFTECSDDADMENARSAENDEEDDAAIDHITKLVAAPWGSFQNLIRVGHSTTSETAPCLVSNDKLTSTYGSTNLTLSSSTAATATTSSVHIYDKDAIGSNIYEDEENDAASDSYNEYVRNTTTTASSERGGVDEMVGPIDLFGQTYTFSKRNVGMAAAVMNGILTGTSFVPVHYAKAFGFGGAHYMVSYAIGALVSNVAIWVIYILVSMIITTRQSGTASISQLVQKTYDSLPQLYFKQMCLPGFFAGLLLTIAMFGSLIAVTDLGQGVGNSLIQAKILISGMWGIFWYKEISDREKIRKWFMAASIAVAGILWLSYERLEADKMNQYFAHHHVHAITKTTAVPH